MKSIKEKKIIGIIYIVSLQKVIEFLSEKKIKERKKSLGQVTNNVREAKMNVNRDKGLS